MTPFTLKKVSDEPILIAKELDSYSPIEHIGDLIDAVIAEVDQFDRPGYGIFVMKQAGYNFNEILEGASLVRDKGERLRNHPKYRGTLFVTSYQINKMAIDGMTNEALGRLFYHVFESVEEALAYAHDHL